MICVSVPHRLPCNLKYLTKVIYCVWIPEILMTSVCRLSWADRYCKLYSYITLETRTAELNGPSSNVLTPKKCVTPGVKLIVTHWILFKCDTLYENCASVVPTVYRKSKVWSSPVNFRLFVYQFVKVLKYRHR